MVLQVSIQVGPRAAAPGYSPVVPATPTCGDVRIRLKSRDAFLPSMADPLDHATRRSTRRSRKREDALLMLSSLGEAHPRFLARAIDVDTSRLYEIMQGRPPRYKVELSPLAMGLATLEDSPAGRVFRITNRGRKRARQLAAARARDAAAKRARSEAAGRTRAMVAPGAPTPEATASLTWTLTWGLAAAP